MPKTRRRRRKRKTRSKKRKISRKRRPKKRKRSRRGGRITELPENRPHHDGALDQMWNRLRRLIEVVNRCHPNECRAGGLPVAIPVGPVQQAVRRALPVAHFAELPPLAAAQEAAVARVQVYHDAAYEAVGLPFASSAASLAAYRASAPQWRTYVEIFERQRRAGQSMARAREVARLGAPGRARSLRRRRFSPLIDAIPQNPNRPGAREERRVRAHRRLAAAEEAYRERRRTAAAAAHDPRDGGGAANDGDDSNDSNEREESSME